MFLFIYFIKLTVDQELAHFDLNLIKRLAFQRLQQIAFKKNEQTNVNGTDTNNGLNGTSSIETIIKQENTDNENQNQTPN